MCGAMPPVEDAAFADEPRSSVSSRSTMSPLKSAKPPRVEDPPPAAGPDSEGVALLPKHKIFLSHSGAQKAFVEQLCEDLENAGHFPFFDRRPESLPKGERFAALIRQAARQCHVAVVVLSMEYLYSKWPMLELIEFTTAIQHSSDATNLKVMPLFYKIGVEDLKREIKQVVGLGSYTSWRGEEALRFLAGINGEVFSGNSELAYRRAIVASICKLYVPDVQYDVSAMTGRDRLCEVVAKEFETMSSEGRHARVVGVHGMGGVGKTLLCKALCNIHHAEFAGRVLHVELKGSKDFKQENIIEAQKLILETLTDASPELLRRISSVEQGNDVLRKALCRRNVFLALDNVPEGSTECVQVLLHFMSPASKAVVTARSLNGLRNVLEGKPINLMPLRDLDDWVASIPSDKMCYIQVPALGREEALELFLHHALSPARVLSPFTEEEMAVLEACIQRCFYEEPGHYHPLSLQALGSYLKGVDSQHPLQWVQKSTILQERKSFYNHSVFDILRVGYDALPSQQDKLMFLDVAVFAPRGKLCSVHSICTWLGAVHGMDQELTLYKMRNLQENSLIEDWEKDKTGKVTVHDLYVEFAEYQIQLEESQRWCVYERDGRALPSCIKSNPPGLRWSSLVRLRLHTKSVIKLPPEKLCEWANLVVLDISLVQHTSLDISPLKNLRSLKLKSFVLEVLTWADDMEELRYVKLSCERLVQPDFISCSNLLEVSMRFAGLHQNTDQLFERMAGTLKTLQISCLSTRFPECLALGKMPHLEVVEIDNDLLFSRPEMGCVVASLGALTRLRRLVLKNLPIKGSLPGLENLVSLEDLLLNRCQGLDSLPGLGNLTNLQRLDVSSTAIEELPGVENASQLRGLYVVSCSRLQRLPDLRSLNNLKEVFTMGCTSLETQPLVADSCVLIARSSTEDTMWLWAKFLDNFCAWTDGEVNFQRVLCFCPTAAVYQRFAVPEKLKALSDAFQEAFSLMHQMADAGRSNPRFHLETDLQICSKIVRLIPESSDNLVLRMAGKSRYSFLARAKHLRRLSKQHPGT